MQAISSPLIYYNPVSGCLKIKKNETIEGKCWCLDHPLIPFCSVNHVDLSACTLTVEKIAAILRATCSATGVRMGKIDTGREVSVLSLSGIRDKAATDLLRAVRNTEGVKVYQLQLSNFSLSNEEREKWANEKLLQPYSYIDMEQMEFLPVQSRTEFVWMLNRLSKLTTFRMPASWTESRVLVTTMRAQVVGNQEIFWRTFRRPPHTPTKASKLTTHSQPPDPYVWISHLYGQDANHRNLSSNGIEEIDAFAFSLLQCIVSNEKEENFTDKIPLFREVSSLEISWMRCIDFVTLQHLLEKCPNLKRLYIRSSALSKKDLSRILEKCGSLELLDLTGCSQVSGRTLLKYPERIKETGEVILDGTNTSPGELFHLRDRFPHLSISCREDLPDALETVERLLHRTSQKAPLDELWRYAEIDPDALPQKFPKLPLLRYLLSGYVDGETPTQQAISLLEWARTRSHPLLLRLCDQLRCLIATRFLPENIAIWLRYASTQGDQQLLTLVRRWIDLACRPDTPSLFSHVSSLNQRETIFQAFARPFASIEPDPWSKMARPHSLFWNNIYFRNIILGDSEALLPIEGRDEAERLLFDFLRTGNYPDCLKRDSLPMDLLFSLVSVAHKYCATSLTVECLKKLWIALQAGSSFYEKALDIALRHNLQELGMYSLKRGFSSHCKEKERGEERTSFCLWQTECPRPNVSAREREWINELYKRTESRLTQTAAPLPSAPGGSGGRGAG